MVVSITMNQLCLVLQVTMTEFQETDDAKKNLTCKTWRFRWSDFWSDRNTSDLIIELSVNPFYLIFLTNVAIGIVLHRILYVCCPTYINYIQVSCINRNTKTLDSYEHFYAHPTCSHTHSSELNCIFQLLQLVGRDATEERFGSTHGGC